ncbi:MAG: hypothetical protein ACRC6A_02845, partial [Fusobacteriaceae bacterium]
FKLYAESVDPKGLGRPIKFDNFEGSLKKDYLNYDVQRQYISNEYSQFFGVTNKEYLDGIITDQKHIGKILLTDDLANANVSPTELKAYNAILNDTKILATSSDSYFKATDIDDIDLFRAKNKGLVGTNGEVDSTTTAKWLAENPTKTEADYWKALYELDDIELIAKINNVDSKSLSFHGSATPFDSIKYTFTPEDAMSANILELTIDKRMMIDDLGAMFVDDVRSPYHVFKSDRVLTPEGEALFDAKFDALFEPTGLFGSMTRRVKGWTVPRKIQYINGRQHRINQLFRLANNLQNSSKVNLGRQNYEPFIKLRSYFKDQDSFKKFFTMDDLKYIKNNSDLHRNLIVDQADAIAKLDVYGTTSSGRITNGSKQAFRNEDSLRRFGEVFSEGDRAALSQLSTINDVFLQNTFAPQTKQVVGSGGRVLNVLADDIITPNIMVGSGLGEHLINPATASMRGFGYGVQPHDLVQMSFLRKAKKSQLRAQGI